MNNIPRTIAARIQTLNEKWLMEEGCYVDIDSIKIVKNKDEVLTIHTLLEYVCAVCEISNSKDITDNTVTDRYVILARNMLLFAVSEYFGIGESSYYNMKYLCNFVNKDRNTIRNGIKTFENILETKYNHGFWNKKYIHLCKMINETIRK